MSNTSDFDNILDDCLARILKGETVEACLASYPSNGAELEPLLRTALDARAAAVIRPRREFRERAASEFQAAIREMPTKDAGPVFWRRRWVSVLAGLVFVLLVGTGVVAGSSGSLPDQPLYGVKLATETVWLAFTPSDLGKAELYVKFTDRRVEEIIAMADRGKIQQLDKATERLDSQMIAMAGLTASDAAALAQKWENVETAPQPMLAAPATSTTTAAVTTVPTITPTATTAAQSTTTVPDTGSAPPPVTVSAPPPITVTLPRPAASSAATDEKGIMAEPPPQAPGARNYGGAVPDEQAELAELLARSAVTNTMALQEELEKAPASARSALERALEIANLGYSEALSNLGW